MRKQTLVILSVHVEIAGALDLEQKKLWWKDNGKSNWKRRYLTVCNRSYNKAIVITIASLSEFLLFKVLCLISFGEAITSRSHEISKPASKHGYPNTWTENFFEKSGNFQQGLSWLGFMKVGKSI